MARLELPRGLRGSNQLPRTLQGLKNQFFYQDPQSGQGRIIGRRGIQSITSREGLARANFEWNGSLYSVYGNSLHKWTDPDDGESTVNATPVLGSERIITSVGFTDIVLMVVSGPIYSLDTSDVLTRIDQNANFQTCRDLTFIDDRWIYIPDNGDPAFFSEVGDPGTVLATSFFDAQELPDKNRAIVNLRNTIYIFGQQSIELFRDIGAEIVPYQRINGARIDYGHIGGKVEYGTTVIFIGNEKDQGPGIYIIDGGSARKISNERIDEILESYTPEELDESLPAEVKIKGHDLATWTFVNDSFGFYQGEWFELDTQFEGDSVPWAAGHVRYFDQSYYSAHDNDFGKFSNVNTDYGNRIERNIDTGLNDPEGRRFSCSRVEVGISQGFNARPESTIATFLSLPGTTGNYASTPDSTALDITGDIDIRCEIQPDDWTPSVINTIVAKNTETGNQRSYVFTLRTDGALRLDWSTDGITFTGQQSSEVLNFTDGTKQHLRATLDVNNGAGGYDVKFYLSEDGINWTQFGDTRPDTGVTSIFSGTGILEMGSQDVGTIEPFEGKIQRVRIFDGIDGTLAFDAQFENQLAGTTSFNESSSNAATVTINQSGTPSAEIITQTTTVEPKERSVALFMSRNNVEYPIPKYRLLGNLGQYNKRLVWQPPGGLGNYLGFMGMRIFTTEDVIFDADSFIVELHQ